MLYVLNEYLDGNFLVVRYFSPELIIDEVFWKKAFMRKYWKSGDPNSNP